MEKPPTKHKHHHVPVFHLKKWYGEDGKFFAYQKYGDGTVRCHKKTAGELFYEKDLYLLREDESPLAKQRKPLDIIEDELAKDVDDATAPVLEKMLRESGGEFHLGERE